MRIKNSSRNNDGTLSFEVEMDPDEADYLITYAVNNLINVGAMVVQQQEHIDNQQDLFDNVEESMQ